MLTQLVAFLGTRVAIVLLQVGLIVLLALVALRALQLGVQQARKRIEKPQIPEGRQERLKTLLYAGRHTGELLILGIATLMVLGALGIDLGPVLAGLGIVGLALSLGAQTLIKDYIGGFLILLEDQFHVGEWIEVGGVSGVVEQITLRVTYLRDVEGKQFIVPNGEVRIVSNNAREFSRAVVDLNVAYDEDMTKVVAALNEAMEKATTDPSIKDYLVETPTVRGWNKFTDWAVQVRIIAKTLPGKQIEVGVVLRRYALAALHSADVQVALPTTNLRMRPEDTAAVASSRTSDATNG